MYFISLHTNTSQQVCLWHQQTTSVRVLLDFISAPLLTLTSVPPQQIQGQTFLLDGRRLSSLINIS